MTTLIDDTDPLLTVSEVAKILRVDDTTVRRWLKSGAMTAVALPAPGKRQSYRIRTSSLHAIINAK